MDHQRIKGTILTILLGVFIAYLPQNWDYIKGDGINMFANTYNIPNDDGIIEKMIEGDIQGIDNSPKKIKILGTIDQNFKKFILFVREDNHRVRITELRKGPNEQYKIVMSTETTLPIVTYQSKSGEKRTLYIGGINQDKKISYVQFQTKDWTQKFEVKNQDIFFTSVEIPDSIAEFNDSDFLISYNYGFFDVRDRNITLEVVSAYKSKWETESYD
ncbi:hypothetical protein [Tepidibacillus marianensis]|uniref:hypothetical protein n=1 Tax=Tepidibacillus marianensis TaxID=3131995 RepID=UPI0030CB5859